MKQNGKKLGLLIVVGLEGMKGLLVGNETLGREEYLDLV
jgi:hypothetical protein